VRALCNFAFSLFTAPVQLLVVQTIGVLPHRIISWLRLLEVGEGAGSPLQHIVLSIVHFFVVHTGQTVPGVDHERLPTQRLAHRGTLGHIHFLFRRANERCLTDTGLPELSRTSFHQPKVLGAFAPLHA